MAEPEEPDKPVDVRVTDDQPPLDVNVVSDERRGAIDEAITEAQQSARGRATESERVSYGQRRINMLWEATQGAIAIFMVITLCWSVLAQIELPTQYWVLAAIVVNAYFQRTNHTKIGGVGATDTGR